MNSDHLQIGIVSPTAIMATSPIFAQYTIRRRRSIEDDCKLRRVFILLFRAKRRQNVLKYM